MKIPKPFPPEILEHRRQCDDLTSSEQSLVNVLPMPASCTITVEVRDSQDEVVFVDEDAKLLLEAAFIGLEVLPSDQSDRLYYIIRRLQSRIAKVQ